MKGGLSRYSSEVSSLAVNRVKVLGLVLRQSGFVSLALVW